MSTTQGTTQKEDPKVTLARRRVGDGYHMADKGAPIEDAVALLAEVDRLRHRIVEIRNAFNIDGGTRTAILDRIWALLAEELPASPLTKAEAIKRAAKWYKMKILRARQAELGSDVMDDVAIALNSEPTYEETKAAELWYELYIKVGAIEASGR